MRWRFPHERFQSLRMPSTRPYALSNRSFRPFCSLGRGFFPNHDYRLNPRYEIGNESPSRTFSGSRRCSENVTVPQATVPQAFADSSTLPHAFEKDDAGPITGLQSGRTRYRARNRRNRAHSAVKPIKQPLQPSSLPLAAAQPWRLGSPWKRPSMPPNA